MKSFHLTHVVTHPSGEWVRVETPGNYESAEEARDRAETMIDYRYSSLRGWQHQEISCVETTEEVAAFEALLGDVAIDVE